ncbi:MAG: prepilin-type N-terminal cleavage/methylation domain-containing protein [Firmicutes bacterium]|nr:prepilin-type N-terminal cleavage/methylation domain-containing protein [Dethiobacter sp.]MBS3889269.1 prepilin-type N-terminal cleavage/methylation domain-containing protein [Bacillota bacterium]
MKLHHKSRQSGFTLIELLAVVAILGILAGIAIPRVLGGLENARTSANNANLALLQSAVERWAFDNNPTTLAGTTGWDRLTALAADGLVSTPATTATAGHFIMRAPLEPYLGRFPSHPTANHHYRIQLVLVTGTVYRATVISGP